MWLNLKFYYKHRYIPKVFSEKKYQKNKTYMKTKKQWSLLGKGAEGKGQGRFNSSFKTFYRVGSRWHSG